MTYRDNIGSPSTDQEMDLSSYLIHLECRLMFMDFLCHSSTLKLGFSHFHLFYVVITLFIFYTIDHKFHSIKLYQYYLLFLLLTNMLITLFTHYNYNFVLNIRVLVQANVVQCLINVHSVSILVSYFILIFIHLYY
jgi:hypothetical protein